MALCLGVGLSAACGFRVFIPPLALSIAAHSEAVQLSTEWQWLGTYPALITLGIAATVEVLAYFIPLVSNSLDSVEIALAPIAGMFVTASSLSVAGEFNPVIVWTVAAIAGGVTAETVEVATSLTRLVASGTTVGMGGPIVSIVEAISSIVLSILAISVPILAMLLVIFLVVHGARRILRFFSKRKRREKIQDQMTMKN
ncbi:MAG: DUF4126 domain-containing protein [Cyanobacteria bacterium P01_D01_bin.50]